MRSTLAIAVLIACCRSLALAQTPAGALERCHGYTASESADPDGAITGCTTVIESSQASRSQQRDALAARGALFRKTGQFDFAITDLTEVLRNRPDADAVYVERGMTYVAAKQPDLAMADFDDAIR